MQKVEIDVVLLLADIYKINFYIILFLVMIPWPKWLLILSCHVLGSIGTCNCHHTVIDSHEQKNTVVMIYISSECDAIA